MCKLFVIAETEDFPLKQRSVLNRFRANLTNRSTKSGLALFLRWIAATLPLQIFPKKSDVFSRSSVDWQWTLGHETVSYAVGKMKIGTQGN